MDNNITIQTSSLVTKEQLASIGVKVSDEQYGALLQHIEESVNQLITEEIVESLADEQLSELDSLQCSGASDEQLNDWMRQNVPEYDVIIEDNVAIILGELAENADRI